MNKLLPSRSVLNGCGDIAILLFQNGGSPPSWICFYRVWGGATHHRAKFYCDSLNACRDMGIKKFQMAVVGYLEFLKF